MNAPAHSSPRSSCERPERALRLHGRRAARRAHDLRAPVPGRHGAAHRPRLPAGHRVAFAAAGSEVGDGWLRDIGNPRPRRREEGAEEGPPGWRGMVRAQRKSSTSISSDGACLASHRESSALRVGQLKRPPANLPADDPILFAQIVDQIVLMAVQPASEGENEESQGLGHQSRLCRSDAGRMGPVFSTIRRLGRYFAPYGRSLSKRPPARRTARGSCVSQGRWPRRRWARCTCRFRSPSG
jgi:hypothetical protein